VLLFLLNEGNNAALLGAAAQARLINKHLPVRARGAYAGHRQLGQKDVLTEMRREIGCVEGQSVSCGKK
jgi:hypothetical protein